MASELVIEGVKPWDGRYELDLERELTTREWGWIKRLSGYLPLALDEAYGDPEFVCVLAAIAIRRAGRINNSEVPAVYDRLIDAPFGATITIDDHGAETGEGDAGPPARSSNGSTSTSGGPSTPSSASSDSLPSATGTPASGSSPSAPPMSVT